MSVETKQQEAGADQWLNELAKPEVQEALAVMIQKLPELKDTVLKIEQVVGSVSNMATDMGTIDSLVEPVDKVSKVLLNPETLDAMVVMIDKLPKIAKTLETLDKLSPFVEALTDKDNLKGIAGLVEVFATPVTERVQDGISMVKEAKERANQNTTTISLFGMMKILKDPAVQNGFKFLQALLDVSAEKKALNRG